MISRSIPCLARIGFACSRISACGVLDAPTVRVSAQEAKLRALRVAAAINVSVFFMMWFLCVCIISVYLRQK
ncbi:hypothetical protein D3C87_2038190 [compost metagenome]